MKNRLQSHNGDGFFISPTLSLAAPSSPCLTVIAHPYHAHVSIHPLPPADAASTSHFSRYQAEGPVYRCSTVLSSTLFLVFVQKLAKAFILLPLLQLTTAALLLLLLYPFLFRLHVALQGFQLGQCIIAQHLFQAVS